MKTQTQNSENEIHKKLRALGLSIDDCESITLLEEMPVDRDRNDVGH